jgi:hypothetical protein
MNNKHKKIYKVETITERRKRIWKEIVDATNCEELHGILVNRFGHYNTKKDKDIKWVLKNKPCKLIRLTYRKGGRNCCPLRLSFIVATEGE